MLFAVYIAASSQSASGSPITAQPTRVSCDGDASKPDVNQASDDVRSMTRATPDEAPDAKYDLYAMSVSIRHKH